jgi:mycothiol synthase
VTITPSQAGQVLSLAARAAAADGVEPLNEEARFALRDGSGEHHLAFEDGELLGYLHWQPAFGTAQLVVDPGHRRQGHGRALLGQLPPEAGVWAFGDLESARGFAAALGLRPRRELLVMARPLADATPPPAPGGVVLRGSRSTPPPSPTTPSRARSTPPAWPPAPPRPGSTRPA